MKEMPDHLRDLDRKLKSLRFEPRASLGPELAGRMRHGEQPASARPSALRRVRPAVLALTGLAAVLAIAFLSLTRPVTVDRCCYDLDGGGELDDGVQIVAERDGRVHRLSIYEDRDRSGSLTPLDLVRFVRSGEPTREDLMPSGLTSIRHCCQDLDGGGPADDGVLVVGTPPDRVFSAAIYELR